ncbi:MAG: ATP phosphoribosyltransferase regulatory subunit [Clostridia bacterium]|nr:ATP phosphoribosyltransferase regulatory subunit [Clostridia bacterium]
MNELLSALTKEERLSLSLRALYKKYGYAQYAMSKFEEYDLYAKNKEFLVSESVITFTDTDGRLMALKPDVTLSIIRNTKDAVGVSKLFYNEHVYRVSGQTKCFKEITQVGLECLGKVDGGVLSEAVFLAEKSLSLISDSYALELSSLDFVEAVLADAGLSREGTVEALRLISEKNEQGLAALCTREGLGENERVATLALVSVYGDPKSVFKTLSALPLSKTSTDALSRLQEVIEGVEKLGGGRGVRVDFSLLGNTKYYNGIAFQGFVEGVPTAALAGGQYDKLVKRVGAASRGVGFAVYLDGLDAVGEEE